MFIINNKSSVNVALLKNGALQVTDKIYVKRYVKNPFTYTENDDGSEVRYLTDINSTGF